MKLQIAGIVHQDPLGRRRLNTWIDRAFSLSDQAPAFIAVEWDKRMLASVLAERSRLEELARETWPTAPASFLAELVAAVAYEGEVPISSHPNVDVLYLDEGRVLDDETVLTQFALDRMRNYRHMFDESLDSFGQEQLEAMSRYSWQVTVCDNPNTRDHEFAKRIGEAYPADILEWGVVVVGACHALLDQGYMAHQLDELGYECRTEQLDTSWAP
jgi:hypothetical protein